MKNPIYKKWWFWAAAVIVLVTLIVITVNRGKDKNDGMEPAETGAGKISEEIKTAATMPTDEKDVEGTQPAQATQNPNEGPSADLEEAPEYTIYPDGFYKVGEDMPAGEYKLFAYENMMGISSYEVAADDTGEFSDFTASGDFWNFIYVTVSDGQYFGINDASAVPAEEAPPYDASGGKYIPGMYKAGVDIPPGEYKLIHDSGYAGYYELCSDSTRTDESIISSGNFTEDIYVTVAAGEYIYFAGAYIEAG
jgi:hypothetical protein